MIRGYVKLQMRSEYIETRRKKEADSEVARNESYSLSKPQAMARPATRNVQRCY